MTVWRLWKIFALRIEGSYGHAPDQIPSGYACELLDRVNIVGYVVVLARYKAYCKQGWKNVAFWEKFLGF